MFSIKALRDELEKNHAWAMEATAGKRKTDPESAGVNILCAHRILSAEEVIWLAELVELGHEGARRLLIEFHIRLVAGEAKKQYWAEDEHMISYAELMSAGVKGLEDALNRFDYRRGTKFSTYATPGIEKAIRRAKQASNRGVRVPQEVIKDISKLRAATDDLSSTLGRNPTIHELVKETGMRERHITNLLPHLERHAISLDAPAYEGGGGERNITDTLPDPAHPHPDREIIELLHTQQAKTQLRKVVAVLPPAWRTVISLRYGLDTGEELTLVEVAAHVDLTKERVRQIEVQAIKRLQSALKDLF